MNGRIGISLLVIFVIVFSSMFMLQFLIPDSTAVDVTAHPFYSKQLENKYTIFILGTSHVGQLNSTLINQEISEKYPEFQVYNLAHFKDNPEKRLLHISKIVELNPKIIFYGISHREFKQDFDSSTNLVPDLHDGFSQILTPEKFGLDDINPKFTTLQIIRGTFQNTELGTIDDDKIYDKYAPFFWYERFQTIISSDEQLLRDDALNNVELYRIGNVQNNSQVSAFKEIIRELQSHNIKVVLFTTPMHQNYLELVDENEKILFKQILTDVSNEFDIKVYDFTEKYQNLPIWMNPTHISYNNQAIMVSQDIAGMILQEIHN